MLTDERINEIHPMVKDLYHWKLAFARAIESEVRAEAQEPVARLIINIEDMGRMGASWALLNYALPAGEYPLFTAQQPPEPCSEQALRYATDLAVYLAKKFYSEVTQWKPLGNLIGVLTQIDNMVAGIAAPAPCPMCEAQAEYGFSQQHKIDALQAKVAELESVAFSNDGADGEAMKAHLERRELRFKVAQQSALIEKCEKALTNIRNGLVCALESKPINYYQYIKNEAARAEKVLALITEYKYHPSTTDTRDAYEQISDFSKGNYRGL